MICRLEFTLNYSSKSEQTIQQNRLAGEDWMKQWGDAWGWVLSTGGLITLLAAFVYVFKIP